MNYKGYTAAIEVDDEAGVLFGRVIGTRDVITFQGMTVEEARREFHASVDDYLAFCAERGEEPERPYSGRFVVRTRPELHRALSQAAEARRQSLNSLVEQLLTRAVEALGSPAEVAGREPRPSRGGVEGSIGGIVAVPPPPGPSRRRRGSA